MKKKLIQLSGTKPILLNWEGIVDAHNYENRK
jgi:hypothetical protein